jgi:hypothetical protein
MMANKLVPRMPLWGHHSLADREKNDQRDYLNPSVGQLIQPNFESRR